jgi:hypothetical protein
LTAQLGGLRSSRPFGYAEKNSQHRGKNGIAILQARLSKTELPTSTGIGSVPVQLLPA